MLKTSASYVLVAALAAGGGVAAGNLLNAAPVTTYRSHHFEIDSQPTAPDGGLEVKAHSYITASTPLADGGTRIEDKSSTGVCPLDAKAYAAAKLLIEYGATPTCR